MPLPRFKGLLEKLFYGNIDYEHYLKLKDQVNDSTDEEIASELQSLWEGHKMAAPMDAATKFEVLSDIHQNIRTESFYDRPRINWWKYAAVIAIPLLAVALYFASSHKKSSHDFAVLTEKGQKSQLLLPDGTKVWLNSASRITYSTGFNEENRQVHLTGEAFFEVKKDAKHVFVVETDQVNVEVHGTAFNVSAYPEEQDIKVSLLNGKVSLTNQLNQERMLEMKPGSQVAVSKRTLQWQVYDCNVENESLWTKNMLRFENATAKDVFTKLEHWYGVRIHVENPDTAIRYGFTLKSESIAEMLNLINKITPVSYRIDGEEVYIKYKKANKAL